MNTLFLQNGIKFLRFVADGSVLSGQSGLSQTSQYSGANVISHLSLPQLSSWLAEIQQLTFLSSLLSQFHNTIVSPLHTKSPLQPTL